MLHDQVKYQYLLVLEVQGDHLLLATQSLQANQKFLFDQESLVHLSDITKC